MVKQMLLLILLPHFFSSSFSNAIFFAYVTKLSSKPVEDGPVGVNRKGNPLCVYVLQELDDSFEEKRLTASHQNKPDIVMCDLVDQFLPVVQRHVLPGIYSATTNISLVAPLAAHSAAKIA
jgi:hypothetical protein